MENNAKEAGDPTSNSKVTVEGVAAKTPFEKSIAIRIAHLEVSVRALTARLDAIDREGE